MFESKSQINSDNLKEVYEQDFAILEFSGKKYCFFQLEITNLRDFIDKHYDEVVHLLQESKRTHGIDCIDFSGIDILEGYNIIFAVDQDSANEIERAIGTADLLTPYQTDRIIMRKEIWAKLIK